MNIIFLNPDQMRADALACYGHPVAQTPSIDRLAGEGTRFDQCSCQHTVCSPSRCSFMTGWYPHVRGHRSLWHLLQPDEPNLMKLLKQAGYAVHWRGKNDLLAPESFAGSVTSACTEPASGRGPQNAFAFGKPGYYSFLYDAYPDGPKDTGDFAQYRWAMDFLNTQPTEPFFLFLPTSLPHPPYAVPQPWHDRVDPASLPAPRPAGLSGKPSFYQLLRTTRHLDRTDDAVFRKLRAVYIGMVEYVDWMIGQLLDTLDHTGLAKNTAILLFSDHGDWTGDYGLVEKWHCGLDDCLTRVPLIIRVPGGRTGHVVREPVELFDVMATALALADVRTDHTHFARDLTPQLQGATGDPQRAAFAEGGYHPGEPQCFEGNPIDRLATDPRHIYYPKAQLQQDDPTSSGRCAMIRTATHKLVRREGDVQELYDLRADPQELVNVFSEPRYAAVRRELEGRLLDWYLHTSDVAPVHRNPRGFAPPMAT